MNLNITSCQQYKSKVYPNIAIFNIAELMSSDNDPVVFSVARNSMLGGTANPNYYVYYYQMNIHA